MGYLRILLAFSVAVGHLSSSLYAAPQSTIIFVGPVVAVKLFFVISGFYMGMIFYSHYPTARTFFISRAMRLFPAYWWTVLFCVAAAFWFRRPNVGPLLDLDFWYYVRSPTALLLFTLSNLTLAGIDFGFVACFRGAPSVHFTLTWNAQCPGDSQILVQNNVIAPAWTLSLEWYFYLLLPLFCKLRTRTVALIAACSFVLTLFIAAFANFNPWYRSLFPAELYLFLLGLLAYRLKDVIPRALGATSAVLAIVAIVAYQRIPEFDWQNPAGANFALYFLFALALPLLFRWGRHLAGERLAGDLSYPIYICHGAVEGVILALFLHERLSLYAWIAINVATVIATAGLLVALTSPFERFRQRFKGAPPGLRASAQVS